MVQVNKANGTVTIELQSCNVEQLTDMQSGIIELINGYRYEDFGAGVGMAITSALDLLTALLPNYEQQKRAFANQEDYIELPKNLTQKQRIELNTALYMIEEPSNDTSVKSPVYDALIKI